MRSLRDILEMKQHNLKIPGIIRVNVLEEVEPEVFIVQDETKVALLKVAKEHIECVKVGKGLIVLPVKLNDFCIAHTHKRISPHSKKKRLPVVGKQKFFLLPGPESLY